MNIFRINRITTLDELMGALVGVDIKYGTIKNNIDEDITRILSGLETIDRDMCDNYNTISKLINHPTFHYLSVKNTHDCTINSTFNLIVNYAIYSKSMKTTEFEKRNVEVDETCFEVLKYYFRQYLQDWYTFFHSIIIEKQNNHEISLNTIRQQEEIEEERIKNMIELLFDRFQLDLRFIHCCSFMLHMVIFTKCAIDYILSDKGLEVLETRSRLNFYNFGYQEKDTIYENNLYYDINCLEQTGTNDRFKESEFNINIHFRRSNKHANYLLKLFCNQFNINPNNNVLLLTDLQSDDCLNTSDINSNTFGYNYCLAKYYSKKGHTNAILFKLKDGVPIEKIHIDDTNYTMKSETKLYTDDSHHTVIPIPPGFYIAITSNDTKPYEHGELTPTPDFHIPSALLFKGGFMQSILIVILVVVVIVCVVIYIHDRKYVKAQQRMLDKK